MSVARLSTLATLFAACGDGAFIEVDTAGIPGIERVEIVVAGGKCHHPFAPDTECDHIQGDGFDRAFRGQHDGIRNIFALGAVADAAIDGAGRASFQLEPGFGVLPMAFAIGRDNQGVALGAAVMENTLDTDAGTIVFHVKLDPVDDLLDSRRAGRAGMREWGVMGSRCIGIAPASNPDRDPAFIVPQDNPDCDARTAIDVDCDPLWFDGYRFDEANANRHCVTRSRRVPPAGNAMEGPCVLGHLPACTENPALGEPCGEQEDSPPLCVPSALCMLPCPSTTSTDECLQDALLGRTTTIQPRVVCQIPSIPEGTRLNPCQDPTITLLPPPNLIASPTKCTDARVTGSDPPFHAARSNDLEVGEATFKVSVDDQCHVTFTFEGSSPIDLAIGTTLVITVDTGVDTRELMFPLELKLGQGICPDANSGPATCTLTALDVNGLADRDMASCAVP